MWEKEQEFLRKLINLTQTDKIRWNQKLDIQYAEYNGQEMHVYWPQDGKPSITMTRGKQSSCLAEYCLGIESLLNEIRKQYERQDRDGYGPTAKQERQKSDEAYQEAKRKEAKDFADAAKKFLEDEEAKKRQ